MIKLKSILNETNLQDNLLDEVIKVLEQIVDDGVGISYNGDGDEIGVHPCCQELSYKPHASDCWFPKVVKLLSILKNNK